ncbi:hypothetical protein CC86DRAFT_5612 [Ophiobolus disseminans]|uniref:Uncharacterized protein n=1 Tax=Ophiobolus disseminans TaxID=1469910 RepID=A0A6A7AIK6_9PLEO|nr:hypothetical protein CC86DRAFT_5612 [Ophiobolus disseminans]
MSTVLSSASPSASSASCSTADFTRFPTADISCAVGSTQGIPSNTSDVLRKCCKSAPVESFNGACGYYCLSVQQSVADLQKCFMEGGVAPASIFCNGNNTATATGTPTGGASRTGSSGSPTGTGASATGGGNTGGAAQGISKAGLGMLGMVFVSAMAGMLL